MTQLTPDYEHNTARTAEHQMRRWALGLEIKERVDHDRAVAELAQRIHPYVALSREAGAGGGEIARRLGKELGWDVLHRELLIYMSQRYKVPTDMLEFVDETTSNWMLEVFGKWLDHRVVTQSEYVVHLGQIVLMAARHANSVFVGRGVQFLLPRDKGLAVQIIAPLSRRVERTMQQRQISREQAQKHVKEADDGRRDFVRRYFHHDVSDPHVYDLVLNLEHMDLDNAVEILAAECRRRFGL
jgi:cytidylate kinase